MGTDMTGKEALKNDTRLAEIEQWLVERSGSVQDQQLTTIDPDYDLVDSGLIDSLRLVEFAFFLGRLTGRRPDLAELRLGQFRTLRLIGEYFLGDLA